MHNAFEPEDEDMIPSSDPMAAEVSEDGDDDDKEDKDEDDDDEDEAEDEDDM